MSSILRFVGCLTLVVSGAVPAAARQSTNFGPYDSMPTPVEILGISVEGTESEFTRSFVRQNSGLVEGQTVTIPGDPAIGDAIRSVYRLGMFSDVRIVEEQRIENGVFLAIRVQEEPKLREYRFSGIKKSHRRDLEKEVPLVPRAPVRPEAVANARRIIREFYTEKGYPLVRTDVVRTINDHNTVELEFQIDRGQKVRVGEIEILGNEQLSDAKIRSKMKTKERRGWRFWRSAKFEEPKYEEDLDRVLALYNERGFYDAKIARDSVYVEARDGKPRMVVQLEVEEGDVYHVRSIDWSGNTMFSDDQLDAVLGLVEGEVYNGTKFEENLYGNKRQNDVASLYLNSGHMRFNVLPSIRVQPGDSLDLNLEVVEGDVYTFGSVDIAGNTKTKEHVIRRELMTVPGQTFGRDAIQESIRRLMQLNYFTQESLAAGPSIDVDDARKSVDIAYEVEETGSDQLELSGTWGRFGLVLQLRFTFNNFSAQNLFNWDEWRPLPSGDGQRLSVGVQTNGSFFQQYSLSFAEPWFRGRPRQAGFSLSYSRIGRNPISTISIDGSLKTMSARVFFDQALKWPDDNFRASTSLGYQFFDNDNWISTLNQGISHEITVRQALSRNSTNHPIFPTSGSTFLLSGEIAPPLGNLIQYHKWRFSTTWNLPLTRKLNIGLSTDYGFIGSLTGETVEFERFVVGGSPFETSGFNTFFGKDVIYSRSYPISVIGPRQNNEPIGGLILNKYTSELRWMAVQTPQLQAAPYLFADAVNTWDGFAAYNPASLFRAAGFGVRLFLPILGMVELTYGRNFDEFVPLTNRSNGRRQWLFQFTLGQGFN